MKLKEVPLKTVCQSCALEAQRVESVIEERDYGDQLAVFIVAREFTHVYENGQKKRCKERLRNPWLMTLCSIEEADKVRETAARLGARNQLQSRILIGGGG